MEPSTQQETDGKDREVPASERNQTYDKDEKKFMRQHWLAGAGSGLAFLATGATLIGLSQTAIAQVFKVREQNAINELKRADGEAIPKWEDNKSLFKDKKTPWIMAGMMGFGAVCMLVSNWLDSKKTLLEWRMGGKKLRTNMQTEPAQGGRAAEEKPREEASAAQEQPEQKWQSRTAEKRDFDLAR
jgi:hypothetical protein